MDPKLAFFDLDHTVLAADCEQTWKNLLVDQGICPEEDRARAQHYINLHAIGKTPRDEYLQFVLREFIGRTLKEQEPLAQQNFETYIRREIYSEAMETIAAYRRRGIPTILLSGSNRVIVDPVARYIGVSSVICTELEMEQGRFTGRTKGPYRIEKHKVSGALERCRANGTTLRQVAFYGDSMSDIPMFEAVGMPYVVNPASQQLVCMAREHGWEVLHWRNKK